MTGRRRGGGFTLVELAIVLVVLGVLARTALAPLGERLERRRHVETARLLDDVRRALVGHLVTAGALPCPLPFDGFPEGVGAVVSGAGTGGIAPAMPCRRGSGRVPAATLGVAGAIDAHGALLDGWGAPLRYSIALPNDGHGEGPASPERLVPDEHRALGTRRPAADLVLCRVSADGACPRRLTRADALAFVVVSTGADASPADIGGENIDGDDVYALAPPSRVPGERFDDLLVWGSRDELAYWLLRAGWLP